LAALFTDFLGNVLPIVFNSLYRYRRSFAYPIPISRPMRLAISWYIVIRLTRYTAISIDSSIPIPISRPMRLAISWYIVIRLTRYTAICIALSIPILISRPMRLIISWYTAIRLLRYIAAFCHPGLAADKIRGPQI